MPFCAGVSPNHHTFTALAMGYSAAGQVAKAVSVLEYMKEAGMPPGVHAFNAVLRGVAHNGDVATCREIFQRLLDAGVRISF